MTKILHKMLLISLMTCSMAIMRPAVMRINDITEEMFNKATIEWRTNVINSLIMTIGNEQDAFFYAAENALVWALAPLIERGADINAPYENISDTLLHVAVRNEEKGVVKVLIAAGANIEAQNDTGDTPLLTAAWGGHEDMVKILLQARADINARASERETPLHHATQNAHDNIVKILLETGAKIDAINQNNGTALMAAQQAALAFAYDREDADLINRKLELCAKMLINAYRELLKHQYPTIRWITLREKNITTLGNLELLDQNCLGNIMYWLSNKDLRAVACVSKSSKILADNEKHDRFPRIKKEKFDAFIDPVLQYIFSSEEHLEEFDRNYRKNNPKMIALLQEAKQKGYSIDEIKPAATTQPTNTTPAQSELDTPNDTNSKKRKTEDDDTPQAKRPKFATDDEAIPAQLGLDAPYGVVRPQAIGAGCAVARERSVQRRPTIHTAHLAPISECFNCQSFECPLEQTRLLTCCLRTICKDHFRQIAQSQDPTCPYCTAPLR